MMMIIIYYYFYLSKVEAKTLPMNERIVKEVTVEGVVGSYAQLRREDSLGLCRPSLGEPATSSTT